MHKIGYGLNRNDLREHIKNMLNNHTGDRTVYFENGNLPSRGWMVRYLKRHNELTLRVPENLGQQRASVTEEDLRSWFNSLSTYLMQEHGIDADTFFAEENAARIFNFDESGFPLAGTVGQQKVVSIRGVKNVYRIAPDSREQITVLGCASAAGTVETPLIVLPELRPKVEWGGVNPNSVALGFTSSGWMNSNRGGT